MYPVIWKRQHGALALKTKYYHALTAYIHGM